MTRKRTFLLLNNLYLKNSNFDLFLCNLKETPNLEKPKKKNQKRETVLRLLANITHQHHSPTSHTNITYQHHTPETLTQRITQRSTSPQYISKTKMSDDMKLVKALCDYEIPESDTSRISLKKGMILFMSDIENNGWVLLFFPSFLLSFMCGNFFGIAFLFPFFF